MVALANRKVGDLSALTKDPAAAFAVLDRFVRNNVMAAESDRLSLAVIMDQASYVFPIGEPGRLNLQASSELVTMVNWAMSPHVKQLNMAFVLVDEKLADLSDRLTGNPHAATIEVPLPNEPERETFIQTSIGSASIKDFSDFEAAGTREADRRHLAHRSQRVDSVGARKRAAAGRRRVPVVEETSARATVPGSARVHRAEMDARHGGRPRGGEGALSSGRRAPQTRRPRQSAHGLFDLRTRRHGKVVSRAVRERRDRRAVRHPEELPVEVRRRNGRQSRARAVGPARHGPRRRRRRRSGRRARQPRAGRETPARRAACSA